MDLEPQRSGFGSWLWNDFPSVNLHSFIHENDNTLQGLSEG